MDDAEGPKQNVLILGDGNFSFSLALCKFNDSLPKDKQFAIIATSFDDRESLLSKYPETRSAIQMMINKFGCDVRHGINATRHLLGQLQRSTPFGHIVFNYPHLGVEDSYLHSHLLGHIFFRCQEAIIPTGNVYISLAEGQSIRWRLKEMAEKNGFRFTASATFLQQQLPGYEMKRHQTGRSFMSRLEDTCYFLFRNKKATSSVANLMEMLLSSVSESAVVGLSGLTLKAAGAFVEELDLADRIRHPKRERAFDEAELIDGSFKKSCCDQGKVKRDNNRSKRRGRMAAAVDGYIRVHGDILKSDTDDVSISEFECKTCHKRFKLEQGARTHVYMIHILGQTEIFSSFEEKASQYVEFCVVEESEVKYCDSKEASSMDTDENQQRAKVLECPFCEKDYKPRSFRNEEALFQHMRAKHGSLESDMKKDPVISDECTIVSYNTNAVKTYPCHACDLNFETEELLHNHIEEGISPPAVVKVQCHICERFFQNQRGLSQHMLSCKNVKENIAK